MWPSRHHILAHGQFHGDDAGHRLDAGDVEIRQLLHEGQNGVQFALQGLQLFLTHRDAREMRHAANGRLTTDMTCSLS